jgi:hypothetical protein
VKVLSIISCFAAILLGANSTPSVRRLEEIDAKWAFSAPRKTEPPKVVGAQAPIDAFLLAKLRDKGLEFAPPADHRTLIRRLSFDLTGLPPSSDLFDLPYEKAVDRLLASPRYGERWARHWLDVVRYGETDGGEHNFERFNAWPYRDYVIRSLNEDLPYDQFVREQIAGDVLFPGNRDKLAATGFLVAGPWDQVSAVLNKDPTQRKMARMDELDDMVTTTGATFLGLTLGCARCHDHKYDPIPTRDYYRLTAAFSGAGFGERSVATAEEQAEYDKRVRPLRSQLSTIEAELSRIESPVSANLLAASYRAFDEARRADARRIPTNPLFNREAFPPITARNLRIVVLSHAGPYPQFDRLEVVGTGFVRSSWKSDESAQTDKPATFEIDLGAPSTVSEIIWTSDSKGSKDGFPSIYRFEALLDNRWVPIASNTDHVSTLEMPLPSLAEEDLARALSAEQRERRAQLLASRAALQKELGAIPNPAKIYAATTRKPERSCVLERGSVLKEKEEVSPGALTSVSQLPAELGGIQDDGQRRLALAKWITDPRNPLTARVIVNRIWFYHFGAGIVNTPSDFGKNGDRPSHPELLDWLAQSFVEHGWSMKWLHKQIVMTQSYRQSSRLNPRASTLDSGNRLLWRMPLRRMDAETLRDSLLWLSGSLDTKMGGPSFPLHQKGSAGSYIYHALENDGPEVWRRAVYRFVVRGGDKTLLDSFDCPDPSAATPQRQISNTPTQALALLNNAFVIRQAGLFAKRLEREEPNLEGRIAKAYALAVGRKARPEEVRRGAEFVRKYSLAAFCRALVNSNEFVYTP